MVHVQACDVGCGMFERMTLDTPQMSLTALSHIFSQLQGGGKPQATQGHRRFAPRSRVNQQRLREAGFAGTRGRDVPWFPWEDGIDLFE